MSATNDNKPNWEQIETSTEQTAEQVAEQYSAAELGKRDTQHPFIVCLIVKGSTRSSAQDRLFSRLSGWFLENETDQSKRIIEGYGYPDGSLLSYRVLPSKLDK